MATRKNFVSLSSTLLLKNLHKTRALIDLGSEVNTITSVYIAKLILKIEKTNIGAQKIESFTLDTFGIVLADF